MNSFKNMGNHFLMCICQEDYLARYFVSFFNCNEKRHINLVEKMVF
jgi:hypothetical protein